MKRIRFQAPLFSADDAETIRLSERALTLMLEALTVANQLHLHRHPDTPSVYQAGVRYGREPWGTEHWQGIRAARKAGIADCEDLAAWRAAELRAKGIPARPVFRSKKLADGRRLYHIVVQHSDGRIEDPSRRLGMQ